MNSVVTVEYRTKRDRCHCCGQELENPEISDVREYRFSKEDFLAWMPQDEWKVESEYEGSLLQIVEEFVCEILSFHFAFSNTKILIDNSEIEKVKEFVLKEVC